MKTLNLPRIFKPWVAAATEDQWIVASGRNSSHDKRQKAQSELNFLFVCFLLKVVSHKDTLLFQNRWTPSFAVPHTRVLKRTFRAPHDVEQYNVK